MTNTNTTTATNQPKGTGYVCKRCLGPSPVGIGYVDHEREVNRRAAAARKACPCGYSAKLA